ncbi:phage tail assembly chaperone GT [Piscibacillus salipiscarius]|nr:hypothetical protein [Piscibacillus salipiscarius]
MKQKVPGENQLVDDDFTPEKQKQYLDEIILKMMKQGKDINDVLNMPFNFVLELLSKETKPREETSLITAFGG